MCVRVRVHARACVISASQGTLVTQRRLQRYSGSPFATAATHLALGVPAGDVEDGREHLLEQPQVRRGVEARVKGQEGPAALQAVPRQPQLVHGVHCGRQAVRATTQVMQC